jgi:hypothetical protein
MNWRSSGGSLTVRSVDPEQVAEEIVDPTVRPAGARKAPGPRSAEAKAEQGRAERATRPIERRTAELRTPAAEPTRAAPSVEYRAPEPEYRAPEPVSPAQPTVPTNIYRARRPAVAVLLIIPAVALGLLFVRALARAAFGTTFALNGVIASTCALVALPMLVAGIYGLVTGAAHGAEQYGFKVWARPPLAYLLVGISFVLAAALAMR